MSNHQLIAIIGIGSRFADCEQPETFWQGLINSKNWIREFSPAELLKLGHNLADIDNNRFVNQGVTIDDCDTFDYQFFNYHQSQAAQIDPQQRLLLECAWATIEDAGYHPSTLPLTSVYASVGRSLTGHQLKLTDLNSKGFLELISTEKDFAATRLAYKLNLQGPTLAVQTACSSSLVSTHLACENLLAYECDAALVAAGNIHFPMAGYFFENEMIMSPTGTCSPFSLSANGTVFSNGIFSILLKRLDDAIAARDHIYAVIHGSAVNNDGADKMEFYAPSANGQSKVIQQALRVAQLTPNQIGYIETHGTGTSIGDAVEISAIEDVMKDRQQRCILGSVKSNLGHMNVAAGLAGLIKTCFIMQNREIPPTLHYVPGKIIAAEHPNLTVNTEPLPLLEDQQFAGVSSFGIGGTNAHVIVGPYQESTSLENPKLNRHVPIMLSARNLVDLKQFIIDLNTHIQQHIKTIKLQDLAFTCSMSRSQYEHRILFVARNTSELSQALSQYISNQYTSIPIAAIEDTELQDICHDWLANENIFYEKIFDCFQRLINCQRISLPSYPFQKIKLTDDPYFSNTIVSNNMHDTLTIESLDQTSYCITGNSSHPLFDQHRVNNSIIIPAAFYIAVVVELLKKRNTATINLKNIAWYQAAKLTDQTDFSLKVIFLENVINIYCNDELTCKAELSYIANDIAEALSPLKSSHSMDANKVYEYFSKHGVSYGEYYRLLEDVQVSAEEVQVNFSTKSNDLHSLVTTTLVLDGLLQSVVGFRFSDDTTLAIPFSIDKINISGNVNYKNGIIKCCKNTKITDKYDLNLYDDQQCHVLQLEGLYLREVKSTLKVFYFTPLHKEIDSNTLLNADISTPCACLTTRKPDIDNKRVIWLQPAEDFEIVNDLHIKINVQQLEPALSWLEQRFTTPIQLIDHTAAEILYKSDDVTSAFTAMLNLTYQTAKSLLQTKQLKIHWILLNPYELAVLHRSLFKSLQAFATVFSKESIQHTASVIQSEHINDEILQNLPQQQYLRLYQTDHKSIQQLTYQSVSLATNGEWNSLIRQHGTYLITGGLGKIGWQMAQWLFTQYKAKIILIGRTLLQDQELTQQSLTDFNCEYFAVDLCDEEKLSSAISEIKAIYPEINGIFHCAGVLDDNLIVNKTSYSIAQLTRAKVIGTINLDNILNAEPLDFMVLCSSISSILPGIGQSDYAYANAFLNEFAEMRNQLMQQGKRSGFSYAVQWPYWQDGSFGQSNEQVKKSLSQVGLTALPTNTALLIMDNILAQQNHFNIAVFYGTNEKSIENLFKTSSRSTPVVSTKTAVISDIVAHLAHIISDTLKIPFADLHAESKLADLHLDSLTIMQINQKLEADFTDISKTLFFEHQTIAEVGLALSGKSKIDSSASSPHLEHNMDIAIIGMSGCFPLADDINQFWENLLAAKDCITEIPASRWSLDGFYNPEKGLNGYSYSKWGGFISSVDQFDNDFFNISQREATVMDPQSRLFMQTAWQAIEDAGYAPENLDSSSASPEVGVFVGCMSTDYQLHEAEERLRGYPILANSAYWSIANRVSYHLDFSGPSMAIDTACSSGLTAIHLACESLRNGDCNVAIAGATNLSIHPNKYLLLSKGSFAASDGHCKSFGIGGDGYVPGEGVAAVVLKPLKQALKDNDCIYGIVIGSAINHGGKTNGYTVPNPAAQTRLITKALMRSKIDVESIDYIEAHGTGTALGDPLEIKGLVSAFKQREAKCPIGSVKSNIGHLEAAAGMAGLIKVLLQHHHQKIVPSIYSLPSNPEIDFNNTPFYVNTELCDFAKKDSLVSCISSFGAGGANGHVIVRTNVMAEQLPAIQQLKYFVFSARDENTLKKYVHNFCNYLQKNTTIHLDRLSYTLLNSRSLMKIRCAFLASSISELIELMQQSSKSLLLNQTLFATEVTHDLEKSQIIQQWLTGGRQSLTDLYANPPQKISLPTYPFNTKRAWYDAQISELKNHEIQGLDDLGRNYRKMGIENKFHTEVRSNNMQNINIQLRSVVKPSDAIKNYAEDAAIDKRTAEISTEKSLIHENSLAFLTDSLAKFIYAEVNTINTTTPFGDLGLDSILGIEWLKRINDQLKLSLKAEVLYTYPNLSTLAEYISSQHIANNSSTFTPETIIQPLAPQVKSNDISDILQSLKNGHLSLHEAQEKLAKQNT